ncbi:MAG: hypothetical protein K1X82_06815 [Bacteroidia bacterium]|nr:hypothetical protein [Bacteroidia bacterium]
MSEKLFKVNYDKIKHLYKVQNDKTSIDKLIIQLKKELGDKILEISVRGLSAGKNDFYFKQIPYGFEQRAIYWESRSIDRKKTRQYYIKIYVDRDKFHLALCNLIFISDHPELNLKPAKESDFYYNRDKSFRLVEKIFKKHTKYFCVSAFCGILPTSEWYARAYIKIIAEVPVTAHDVFVHSDISNLSEFGLNHIEEIGKEFAKIVTSENVDLHELYQKKSKRHSISRRAENIVRKKHGFKNVGDMYINETMLANYTKSLFPDTIRQYSAKWLGKYLIDIFIPSLNIAIEYHGEQHFKAIDRFGGEEKLLKQQKRDEFVREQCKKNGVLLLELTYEFKVTEKNVYDFLSQHIDIPNYKRPFSLFD